MRSFASPLLGLLALVASASAKLTFYSDLQCQTEMAAYTKESIPASSCIPGVDGVRFEALTWTGGEGTLVFYSAGVNGVSCEDKQPRNGLWQVYVDGKSPTCLPVGE
jgi:hypothetical protein